MARTLTERISDWWRRHSVAVVSSESPVFVPHAEWSEWIAKGQWDRAAVLIEELKKKNQDESIARLIPNWEKRLIESFLRTGWAELNTASALRWLRRVDRFPDRGLVDPRLETFRQVADSLWDADRARLFGDCRHALALLNQARILMESEGRDVTSLDELRERVTEDHEILLQLNTALRIHEEDGRPEEACAVARRILAIAPSHRGALAVSKRLGEYESAGARYNHGLLETEIPGSAKAAGVILKSSDHSRPVAKKSKHAAGHEASLGQISLDRAATWLVSEAEKLVIDSAEDPRFADLFGEASGEDILKLERDSEGCWLFESTSGILVDDRLMHAGCLMDGQRVRLNERAPELRFSQPRTETGTARLELRNRSSVKGIKGLLLLGEIFSLGGSSRNAEIPHPEIEAALVIARSGGRWIARRSGLWTLDGLEIRDEAVLVPPCRIRIGQVGIFWES